MDVIALIRTFHLRSFWRQDAKTEAAQAQWKRDPLSHPALRQMSKRELSDLPFDPGHIDAE
ncbi:hypothetical protein [uncultured Roseobacter sp.]|uniref:hypothetical protein n=1 Tax=uncultured Roseobacter sp. TaxID=114847 RepID=UPI002618EA25|nr:hypothetical protein [uncultured Roseobacter sp.]